MQTPKKLLNRNFLLLWQGQSISRLGTQGFLVAMLFWVKHATESATTMGLLQMFSTLPAVFLGPIAGTFADRQSRRKILILSDFMRGIAVLSLAALLFFSEFPDEVILIWLFIVAVFNATVSAFFEPAITASIPSLVPEEKISSANSLGQLSFQLSVFIGQGLGGTFYRLLGAPLLFLVDSVTYLFAAASETFINIPQVLPEKSDDWRKQFNAFKHDLVVGVQYVWERRGLRTLVFVSAFLTFFTTPIIILLPFYIEDVLQVKIDWYGFLLAAYGLGTVAGYLFAGAIKIGGKTRGQLMLFFIVAEAFGYGLLGLVSTPVVALALAAIGGFASGYFTINLITILQITTKSEVRGRVFGLLGTISAGLAPIAMGLAGVIADLLNQNIRLIYLSCGLIMTALTIFVTFNQDFRELLVYEPKKDAPPAVKEPVASIN